ncbi:hypothetical protein D3C87_1968870 [compost metagenome]
MGLHRSDMLLVVADREQAAMNAGMQGLDAAVHDFGKAGDFGNIGDRNASRLDGAMGAAGRQ